MTNISIFGMFSQASFLVQLIMLGLLAASVISWTFIFQRWQVYRRIKEQAAEFEHVFWSGIELPQLYDKLLAKNCTLIGIENIFFAGFKEFLRMQNQAPKITLENVERAMWVSITRESQRLEQNLNFLATVQSTSPYVGLFGTVWGIMNAMSGLGVVQHATLAMVAPGISEALVATAMGLFAAIPAGIAYNRYALQVDNITSKYQLFAEEFNNLLQRKLHKC